LDDDAVERELCDGRVVVLVRDGVFAWDDEEVLRGINLEIQGGALAAVVGMVGSGKSSLLGCILGEMTNVTGKVYIPHQFFCPEFDFKRENAYMDHLSPFTYYFNSMGSPLY
jgi:ABC-type Mn2+/Zn2+ transport system ATPase subunit